MLTPMHLLKMLQLVEVTVMTLFALVKVTVVIMLSFVEYQHRKMLSIVEGYQDGVGISIGQGHQSKVTSSCW